MVPRQPPCLCHHSLFAPERRSLWLLVARPFREVVTQTPCDLCGRCLMQTSPYLPNPPPINHTLPRGAPYLPFKPPNPRPLTARPAPDAGADAAATDDAAGAAAGPGGPAAGRPRPQDAHPRLPRLPLPVPAPGPRPGRWPRGVARPSPLRRKSKLAERYWGFVVACVHFCFVFASLCLFVSHITTTLGFSPAAQTLLSKALLSRAVHMGCELFYNKN